MRLCLLIAQQNETGRYDSRIIIIGMADHPTPISITSLINTVIVGAVEDLGRLKEVATGAGKFAEPAIRHGRTFISFSSDVMNCRACLKFAALKINLHRPTREAGDRGQIGSGLPRRFRNLSPAGAGSYEMKLVLLKILLFQIFLCIQRQLDHAFQ